MSVHTESVEELQLSPVLGREAGKILMDAIGIDTRKHMIRDVEVTFPLDGVAAVRLTRFLTKPEVEQFAARLGHSAAVCEVCGEPATAYVNDLIETEPTPGVDPENGRAVLWRNYTTFRRRGGCDAHIEEIKGKSYNAGELLD